jgi:hypothetical protein
MNAPFLVPINNAIGPVAGLVSAADDFMAPPYE